MTIHIKMSFLKKCPVAKLLSKKKMTIEFLIMNDERIKRQFSICKFKDSGLKILSGTTIWNKRMGVNGQEFINIFSGI